MVDDGIQIKGSLGAPVISYSTGAGVGLTSGFWVVTQGFYTQPPIVDHFVIMDDELNVGEGVNLMAKFSDFNGILNAKIYVNVGGQDSVLSFPMERTDSTFTAFIPDSLVKIENFIVSAEVIDSLSYAARSSYLTSPVRFGEDVSSSRVDDSAYPLGIPDEKWRLVSFPGELENGTLTSTGLNEKHVFYSRDWESNEWFVPDTLYLEKHTGLSICTIRTLILRRGLVFHCRCNPMIWNYSQVGILLETHFLFLFLLS